MPVINDAQKTRDRALTLAAQGLSYAQAGQWAGCVKSTIGKWLRRTPLTAPRFVGKELSLEMDGLWTRTRAGGAELKVIRDADTGAALGSFGRWAEAPVAFLIRGAWQLGAQHTAQLVSDGAAAIAAGIELVYGRRAPHQLCVFHLLREYWRNWPDVGDYCRLCGGAGAATVGQCGGRTAVGAAAAARDRRGGGILVRAGVVQRVAASNYGADQAADNNLSIDKGVWSGRIGNCGGGRIKAGYGTVWTEHNLLALQQIQGRLNPTT